MGSFVGTQVAGSHGGGKRRRLLERESHSITGDGVEASGSVAYQSYIASLYVMEGAYRRDRAAFPSADFLASEFFMEFRKFPERSIEKRVLHVIRQQHDADLVAAHWSYVCLGMASPMNFHVVRPGSRAKMPPDGKAPAGAFGGFQCAPPAHARTQAIGSHDPAGLYFATGEQRALRVNAANWCVPKELHATFFGSGDHPLVQDWAGQAETRSLQKICGDPCTLLRKAYAGKFLAIGGIEFYAQGAQGLQSFGHHAFAARLFNGRRGTIRDDYIKSLLT